MELRIHGLDCVEEVALLKRELVPLVGEDKLGFDVLNGRLVVDLSSTDVPREQIMSSIEQTGLKAEPWQSEADAIQQLSFWSQHQRTILTAVSGVFGALGLITQIATSGLGETGGDQISIVAIGLYGVAILAGLYLVLPKAWRSAVTLRPDMNLLMSVAVVGAVLIGEWFEGATVAFLFSLSLLLESWSISRARRAVAA